MDEERSGRTWCFMFDASARAMYVEVEERSKVDYPVPSISHFVAKSGLSSPKCNLLRTWRTTFEPLIRHLCRQKKSPYTHQRDADNPP